MGFTSSGTSPADNGGRKKSNLLLEWGKEAPATPLISGGQREANLSPGVSTAMPSNGSLYHKAGDSQHLGYHPEA
ncbi:hypothetical protein EYF80_015859 [Liparis tanakae]|uniref:Uncharacterized protein n=1 Tax=Liparis tanakae TaxID=230148 RepID=A0A4Z2I8Y0_9TELE|nr:hypothetical protein EYF80_015859 [Liparis tanakae]